MGMLAQLARIEMGFFMLRYDITVSFIESRVSPHHTAVQRKRYLFITAANHTSISHRVLPPGQASCSHTYTHRRRQRKLCEECILSESLVYVDHNRWTSNCIIIGAAIHNFQILCHTNL